MQGSYVIIKAILSLYIFCQIITLNFKQNTHRECKYDHLFPNIHVVTLFKALVPLRLDNTSQGLHCATPVFWQFKIMVFVIHILS